MNKFKPLLLGNLKGYSDSRLRSLISSRIKMKKEDMACYYVVVAYEEELDWCRGYFFLLKNKTSPFMLEAYGYQDGVSTRFIIPHSAYFDELTFLHLDINGKSTEELGEMKKFLKENAKVLLEEKRRLPYFNHSTNVDTPEGET